MDILLTDPHYKQMCILCKLGPGKSYFAALVVASRGKTTRKRAEGRVLNS